MSQDLLVEVKRLPHYVLSWGALRGIEILVCGRRTGDDATQKLEIPASSRPGDAITHRKGSDTVQL